MLFKNLSPCVTIVYMFLPPIQKYTWNDQILPNLVTFSVFSQKLLFSIR